MLPIIKKESYADLKVIEGPFRVWLEKNKRGGILKYGPKAFVEQKINGIWGVVREYRPKKAQEGFDYMANPHRQLQERKVVHEKYDSEKQRGYTIFRCYRNFQTWYVVSYFHKNSKKEMEKEFNDYDDAENFAERFFNQ